MWNSVNYNFCRLVKKVEPTHNEAKRKTHIKRHLHHTFDYILGDCTLEYLVFALDDVVNACRDVYQL